MEGIRAAGVFAEADFRVNQSAYRNFDKFEKKIDRLKKKLGELQSGNFTVGGRIGSGGAGGGYGGGGRNRGWVGGLSDIAIAFRKREAMIKTTAISLENSMRKMEISPDAIKKARQDLEGLNQQLKSGKTIQAEYKAQVRELNKQLHIQSKANREARITAKSVADATAKNNAGLSLVQGPWVKKAAQKERLIDQKVAQFERTARSLGWQERSKEYITHRAILDGVIADYNRAPHAVNNFKKSIEGLDLQMRRTADGSFANLTKKLWNLRTGMVGAALFGTVLLGNAAIDTGKKFESMRTMMTTAFGKDSLKEIAFLRAESNRLGMDMVENAKSYTQIAFAMKLMKGNLSDARKIFSVMGEASIAFGLDQESVSRSFKAIMQMYSKGVLTSEEMRQQLGDSLAGVMPMLAEAVGVPIEQLDDMMKKKLLTTDQFMMKFIDVLRKYAAPGVEAGMEQFALEQNKTNNFWKDFKDNFFQGLKPMLVSSLQSISSVLVSLTPIFKLVASTLSLILSSAVALPGLIFAAISDLYQLIIGNKAMRRQYGEYLGGMGGGSKQGPGGWLWDMYTNRVPHLKAIKEMYKVVIELSPTKDFEAKVKEGSKQGWTMVEINTGD